MAFSVWSLAGAVSLESNRVVAGTMILQDDAKVRSFTSRLPDLLMLWCPVRASGPRKYGGIYTCWPSTASHLMRRQKAPGDKRASLTAILIPWHHRSQVIGWAQVPCVLSGLQGLEDRPLGPNQRHCSLGAPGSLCMKCSFELASLTSSFSDHFYWV